MTDKFNKVVLSIHAHPDDAEAWCAGTLKLLKEKGFTIVIITLSAGGLGNVGSTRGATIALRQKEAQRAAKILNAEYHYLGGRDGYLYDTRDLRIAVTSLVRKYRAGVVITHLPMDYHPDHRATATIVEAGCAVVNLDNVASKEKPLMQIPVVYHSAPMTLVDPIGAPIPKPHFYIDVSSAMETKMAMLQEHKSQKELMKVMWGIEDFFASLRQTNANYGKEVGCEYAEPFWKHGGAFPQDNVLEEELSDFLRR